MNRKLILILLLLICRMNWALSQDILAKDSVSFYSKKLSWDDVHYKTSTFSTQLKLSDIAGRLLSCKDSTSVYTLYSYISDSTKTVVIHIILTRMFEPANGLIKESYIKANGLDPGEINYTYNNLTWTFPDYEIKKSEILKIKRYWKQKLKSIQWRSRW